VESVTDTAMRYRCAEPNLVNPQILARLAACGLPVLALAELPRSLEEVYLRIVGEGMGEGTGNREQGAGEREPGAALLSHRPAL